MEAPCTRGKNMHTLTAKNRFQRKIQLYGTDALWPTAPGSTLAHFLLRERDPAAFRIAEDAFRPLIFQPGLNDKTFCRAVPADIQLVRLAAHLTVFHIALAVAARLIHDGLVPFSTPGALKTSGVRHCSFRPPAACVSMGAAHLHQCGIKRGTAAKISERFTGQDVDPLSVAGELVPS